MTNLTLSIDEQLLKAARIRAVKEGTSVNEICRKAIENYAREDGRERVKRFDELMARIDAEPRPPGGPLPSPWRNRNEMYDELLSEAPAPPPSRKR
jgi:hypothetical protein